MINTGTGTTTTLDGRVGTNTIVASGKLDQSHGDSYATPTNVTIATGGELDGDSKTLTVAGDFTTSGGLLGASCLDLTGSSSEYAYNSGTTWGFGDAWTIEFWFKTSTDSDMTLLDLHNDSNNNNRILIKTVASSNEISILPYASDGSTSGGTLITSGEAFQDGKWHHIAFTSSGTTKQIFYDGKLSNSDSIACNRDADPTMRIRLGRLHPSSADYFTGQIDEVRFFSDVRTQAEIRADMFQGGTLANSGNLVARYSFDEGTGQDVDNSEGTGARDLTLYDAGGAEASALWPAAGTFTYGTSTLVFNGTSSKYYHKNDEAFYKLTVNSGKTLTLHGVHASGTALLPKHNLTINGTLASNGSERLNFENSFAGVLDFTGGTLTGLNKLQMTHTSGTILLPACTTARLDIDGNGGTTKLTGAVTITDACTVDYGDLDIDSQTLTLGTGSADMSMTVANNADIKLTGGTIKMGTSGTSSGISFNTTMTLTATSGSTIQGYSSSNRAKCKFRVENGLELVGTAKDLEMVSDSDTHQLTVIGPVINCTVNNTDDKFIQWHHTIDTQQLLDADSAGDDDMKLPRPSLDNALQLQTGG